MVAEVDLGFILPSLDLEDLLEELKLRGCPPELLAPILEWADGRLSLTALRALAEIHA